MELFCAIISSEDSDEISYRGDEAVDCFGMQSPVEPVCGLCGNHKPNRFIELKENALLDLAFWQGLYTEKLFCFANITIGRREARVVP